METGFLLTKQSYHKYGQSIISLWVKTQNGPVKLLIYNEPYVCFMASKDVAKLKKLCKQEKIEIVFKAVPLKTFSYTWVNACYLSSFYNMKRLIALAKNKDIVLYETDIKLCERYLMERFVCGGLAFIGKEQLRTASFRQYTQVQIKSAEIIPQFSQISLDIECSHREEIYSVALYSQKDSCVFMVGEKQNTQENIIWCANEKRLLKCLVKWFQEVDPDLIIGWNVVDFDMQLLIKRAAIHGVNFAIGRGASLAVWRQSRDPNGRGFLLLEGRVVLDGITALKNAGFQFPSWTLESVAQQLLGEGKNIKKGVDAMGEIQRMFTQDKEALALYNLQDCKLVAKIFADTHVLDFLIQRVKLTGLALDRFGGSVAAFNNLYIPKMHRAGFVAPSLQQDNWTPSPGGYVMDSKPGLYSSVLVLDFKSLYPSIIRTFNIDPISLVEGLYLQQKNPQDPDLIPGFRGGIFHRKAHILPEMIAQLWAARDQAKRDGEKVFSQAIKIIMNSFYGVLGASGCRFFDHRLASSITMRGHEILKTTKNRVENLGYEVIYGDTDSIFVWLREEKTENEANNIGHYLASRVNDYWKKSLKEKYQLVSALEIEYETHYLRFHMPTIRNQEQGSKKRYAGLIKGDKLVFKGLESVRSDWTPLAQDFQRELYQRVFHHRPVDLYIEELVAQVRTGKLDAKLVYHKRIRRPLNEYRKNVSPQIKAARIADAYYQQQERQLQYQNGGWIAYVMTIQGAQPVEYITAPIDYEHYIDKQLKPIADSVLIHLGFNFDDFAQPQMGLF